MGSFTKKDILNFAMELGINTAKDLARSGIKTGIKTVRDNVDAIKEKVIGTVDDLQKSVNTEVEFIEFCLLAKPGFEKLVANGVDTLKAFKRAVREMKVESSKNEKGGER